MNLMLPFGSKTLPDGKKLYRRKHGYTFSQTAGTVTHEIVVPYAFCKTNHAELVGCPEVCLANFKVLDTAEGTYSGVPNALLNQFGFDVNVAKDAFRDIAEYEADLYTGMRIVIELTSATAFTFGVNIVFHEVVNP